MRAKRVRGGASHGWGCAAPREPNQNPPICEPQASLAGFCLGAPEHCARATPKSRSEAPATKPGPEANFSKRSEERFGLGSFGVDFGVARARSALPSREGAQRPRRWSRRRKASAGRRRSRPSTLQPRSGERQARQGAQRHSARSRKAAKASAARRRSRPSTRRRNASKWRALYGSALRLRCAA